MRPSPPDLRTLTTTRGLTQWAKRRYRNATPRLHAVGAEGLTACRRVIPKHATTEVTPDARPCVNCASHLSGVWRTGRPRGPGSGVVHRLPDLGTAEGRQELLDAAVDDLAPALGIAARHLDALPPTVRTGRDALLSTAADYDDAPSAGAALCRALSRATGLSIPCDPDALDAWVAGEAKVTPPGTRGTTAR